jgi:hypothetical protein
MNFFIRLWRTLLRVALVLIGLLLGLVLLAVGLTLGLAAWLWLRWRGVRVNPVQWAGERVYRPAQRVWRQSGGASASPADVVDVEAVVRSESPRSVTRPLIDPPT